MYSDMTNAYQHNEIPAKQRLIVDPQLEKMRVGQAPTHFRVAQDMLKQIQRETGFPVARFELLDAGCSSAYYSEIFDYMCPGMVRYTGVDYSPAMVELAHTLYPSIPVYCGDLANLNMFLDKRFDIGFTGATIIHMGQWKTAIRELARVSRDWVILHRTNVWEDETPTSCARGEAYDVAVDYYTFNQAELIDWCSSCGFTLHSQCETGEGVKHGAIKTFLLERMQYERIGFTAKRLVTNRFDLLQPATAYTTSY